MSPDAICQAGGLLVGLFSIALMIHQSLPEVRMADPTSPPDPTPVPAPSPADQVDSALADLRNSQSSLTSAIAAQAGTATALVQAQASDVAAKASMASAAQDRDQKRASLEALIEHIFSSTPPFA